MNLSRAFAFAAAALAACLLTPSAAAQQAPARWADRAAEVPVSYTIEAELKTLQDEDSPRLIKGRETIRWTNPSRAPVDVLYFHLYANAFADARSAFLRERARDGRDVPEDMVWGGIEVQSVTAPLSPDRQPIPEWVPAEGAPDDRTVMRVKLPHAVEPRGTLVLHVDFTTRLPKPVARMGAVKDFVMAAQWYPKLGRFVGDQAVPYAARVTEGWYCPHYHAAAEFAADFADYDVALTVPAGWTVGSTGVREGDDTTDPATGALRLRRRASSVVDFAWTAGARLSEIRRRLDPDAEAADGDRLGKRIEGEVRSVRSLLQVSDEDLPEVEVVLLLQPEHADQAERHFDAARVALALYGTWLGPYPYPRLTVVDPPHGVPVGGMEYPTLVTAGTSIGAPEDARRLEHVVVHEIGHQWFMNLLASNEFEEAWLDEGLNSWFTARAMDVAWGAPRLDTEVLGLHFGTELPYTFPGVAATLTSVAGLPSWAAPAELPAFRLWRDAPALLTTTGRRYRAPDPLRGAPGQSPILPARRSWNRVAGWDEMVRPGWEFLSADSYRGNAYPRGMLLLDTIERHVRLRFDRPGTGDRARDGERRMARALREYAREQRFRHPTTADLLRVLRKETELPEVAALFDRLARSTGVLDYAVDPADVRVFEEPGAPGAPKRPRSEVVVRRRGEVAVPLTVRLHLHGESEPRSFAWDGAERWKRFAADGRVRRVEVDADRLFLQDARLSDNQWSDRASPEPGVKWGVRALLWLEDALAGYGRFY